MKHYLYLALGSLILAGLVACGKSSSDSTVQAPACGVEGYVFYNGACIPQSSIIGLNAFGQCPAGYTVNGAYCYPNNVAGINGAIAGIGFYSDNYCGRTGLTIASGKSELFKSFLRDAMGVCNRAHANGGVYNCDTYVGGLFDMVVQAPSVASNSLQATFRSSPRNNFAGGYGQWGYQLPSWRELLFGIPSSQNYYGAYLPKMAINMAVSITNSNQGFEARGNGDLYSAANRSLIQIKVPVGKLDNPFGLDYQLFFKGELMASGKMLRCQSIDCGLSFSIGTCL